MSLTPIVAGNWKMHKTPSEGASFIELIKNLLLDIEHVSVIFAPPFTGLFDLNVKPPFYSAAQNCHWEQTGAFTGEISVSMIRDCGAQFVIIGHSERRHVFGESDEWINRKVKAVLDGNMKPILCIGELLNQRDAGQTEMVLKSQLEQGLAGVEALENIVIACLIIACNYIRTHLHASISGSIFCIFKTFKTPNIRLYLHATQSGISG